MAEWANTPDDASLMKIPWFVRGDIDGFFGLFIDNLLQLMVIAVLGRAVCGFSPELINGRILPGAAVSILVGNLFYAWQARRLARQTGRANVTALPYGINTPSVFAYILLIMGPVYQETRDPQLAWRAGLLACFLSGVMETAGAFAGDWLRRHTPRAALLSALAGIALTFIAMGFLLDVKVWICAAFVVPAGLAGLWAAGHLFRRISREGLMRAVAWLLLASGTSLVLRALG